MNKNKIVERLTDEEARNRVSPKHLATMIDGIIRAKTENLPKPDDEQGEYEMLYALLVRQGKDVLDESKWSLKSVWAKQLPEDWKKAFAKALKDRREELGALLAGENPMPEQWPS